MGIGNEIFPPHLLLFPPTPDEGVEGENSVDLFLNPLTALEYVVGLQSLICPGASFSFIRELAPKNVKRSLFFLPLAAQLVSIRHRERKEEQPVIFAFRERSAAMCLRLGMGGKTLGPPSPSSSCPAINPFSLRPSSSHVRKSWNTLEGGKKDLLSVTSGAA